ncbi:TRAP transporter substrate-binding protein [Collimonas silvisoli]|uniref:TRAP transporter substrate-binding protein n=1 Tax=Collimonas silvisoli TaxID=2825884 RepID=UPI001B8AAFC3|nr:TRAP transporter substrate-binding protein [Collimonas silvisoli]
MLRELSWGRYWIWLLLVMLNQSSWAASLNIQIASAYDSDNFQAENLQHFASDVAKATDDQVNFQIHTGGRLLKPDDIFSGVLAGKADGGEVLMSSLTKVAPLFEIDSLPFIVSGYDDAHHLWEVSRPGIEKALSDHGLQLLYAVPWPPQNLYSKFPVNAIRDFKGLRMRNYNATTDRIATLVGATPVMIQVVDLGKAIADQKLDLMITSSWTGVEEKAWTNLRYYYKVNAWIPKNIVFVSKKILAGLEPSSRKKIIDAAYQAEQRGWKSSRENDIGFESQLVANKVSVAILDPLIQRHLDRIGEGLAREWFKKASGDDIAVLLKYISDRAMR